jgi:hypothetical protein
MTAPDPRRGDEPGNPDVTPATADSPPDAAQPDDEQPVTRGSLEASDEPATRGEGSS